MRLTVQVEVMVTHNPPGGIGEVGLPPTRPAIANATAAPRERT
jgi:isoquinoline 1-oxidoreductase beta subunit